MKPQPPSRPDDLDDDQVGLALVALVPTFEHLAKLSGPDCEAARREHIRPFSTLLQWSHEVPKTKQPFEPVFLLGATCLTCDNQEACASFKPMLKLAMDARPKPR